MYITKIIYNKKRCPIHIEHRLYLSSAASMRISVIIINRTSFTFPDYNIYRQFFRIYLVIGSFESISSYTIYLMLLQITLSTNSLKRGRHTEICPRVCTSIIPFSLNFFLGTDHSLCFFFVASSK